MKLPFTDNHISFVAQKRVQQILQPLSNLADIHYFNYSITYPNYTNLTLPTNAEFYQSWFVNHFPMCEYHLNSGWYMWDEMKSLKKKTEIAHGLGIGNGIVYIKHDIDKTFVSAFATAPDNTNIISYYLNNLNLLLRFVNYFENEAADLIRTANKQLIKIPEKMLYNSDFIDRRLTNINACVFPQFNSSPFNLLSDRELQCYSLLIKGCSLAYISKKLNVAIPTVNNYISRIKQKFNCDNREELIQLAEDANLVKYFI